MAALLSPSSPSSSSSRASNSPSLLLHRSHLFTPIQEGNESEETEERHRFSSSTPSSTCAESVVHHPTPLHPTKKKKKKPPENPFSGAGADDLSVSCNNCRPTTRDRISIVPVDPHHAFKQPLSMPSPNAIFKSIVLSLSRKSPKPQPETAGHTTEDTAELTQKLLQASRKRDEAILEASRLKYAMAELEKKLNRVELYCHNLKSGLEICNTQNQKLHQNHTQIENFLVAVSESRSMVRALARALAGQLRLMGPKVMDRVSTTLQAYDIKVSIFKANPKVIVLYLESLLNIIFFEDFETVGFYKNSANRVLNPLERCQSNYKTFTSLRELTWDEVLSKGTRHFSEEFSRFCDRKMSEIVGFMGLTRAWPEPLLQAFFGAAKGVFLVHLLANSVHPSLMVLRVDKGASFDGVYMDEMGGSEKGGKVVRIMVQPGFYVYDNVIKCKVLCRYYNSSGFNNDNHDSGFNNDNPDNNGVILDNHRLNPSP